jgi:hypothetical protein
MTIAFFSCQPYEQSFLEAANGNHRHQLVFLPQLLTTDTVLLAAGCLSVCVFINDQLSRPVCGFERADALAERAGDGPPGLLLPTKRWRKSPAQHSIT